MKLWKLKYRGRDWAEEGFIEAHDITEAFMVGREFCRRNGHTFIVVVPGTIAGPEILENAASVAVPPLLRPGRQPFGGPATELPPAPYGGGGIPTPGDPSSLDKPAPKTEVTSGEGKDPAPRT